jgi:hypothetical protein
LNPSGDDLRDGIEGHSTAVIQGFFDRMRAGVQLLEGLEAVVEPLDFFLALVLDAAYSSSGASRSMGTTTFATIPDVVPGLPPGTEA